MRRLLPIVVIVLCLGDAAAAQTWLIPPVDGPIERRFEYAGVRWEPGHRGIDYFVPEGTAVRAAGAGTIRFAGHIGSVGAVTIDHGGIVTTYSDLSEVHVARGEVVDEGRWIGLSGEAHPGRPGLHLGVKVEGDYVDPLDHLGRLDPRRAIHLAPLAWSPDPPVDRLIPRVDLHAPRSRTARCIEPRAPGDRPPPPNDNVAVAIAGIASKTAGGLDSAIYRRGLGALGYRARDVYRFSYAGVDGDRFHRPYERTHTYRDLRTSAAKLRDLLVRIGRRHPGRGVDLIAHSQGGMVARALLEWSAEAYDARVPQIENLVTFATPHRGTPVADLPRQLGKDTLTGRFVTDGASWLARRGLAIPDPASPAVKQLAPGSPLVKRLAREDVLFGTKVLALAIPHDLIVPADHALYPGEESRVVPVSGWNGHQTIVSSDAGTALAYAFLRGAPPSCGVGGSALGSAISWFEGKVPWLYARAEDRVGGAAARVAGRVLHGVGRVLRR